MLYCDLAGTTPNGMTRVIHKTGTEARLHGRGRQRRRESPAAGVKGT